MPEPFTIGIALGLGALLLSGKGGPPGGRLPPPDTKDLVTVTEWKKTPQGLARYYRAAFIPSIATNLASTMAVKVVDAVYKGAKVLVYQILEQGDPAIATAGSAAYPTIDLCKIAHNANAAVLITTNYWIRSGGKFYMAVIPYSQRAEWSNLGRQWAVEFDDQAGEESAPPVKVTPGRKTPSTTKADDFDANMTQEEKESAAALLLRDDLDPGFYEQQAIAAETNGHAGTTHGTHPKCAKLMRKRKAELEAKIALPEKKDPWGKIPGGTPGGKDVPPEDGPPKDGPPAGDVEPTFDTLLVNGYPYKDITVQRHEVTQKGGGAFSSDFQTPKEVAVFYGQPESEWVRMLPINPLMKKAPTAEGVSPWPNPSGFVWIPAKWMDDRLKMPASLPAGCDPGAASPPPWGEMAG